MFLWRFRDGLFFGRHVGVCLAVVYLRGFVVVE